MKNRAQYCRKLLDKMVKLTQTKDQSTHVNEQRHARSQEPSDAYEWNQLDLQPKEEV